MKIIDTKTGRGVGYLLVNLTAIQPLYPAFAADGGIKTRSPQTQLITINGKPVINIAKPNQAGVSHNTYHEFNVGKEGTIINNAVNGGVFNNQVGFVAGNPQLQADRKTAKLIINEVVDPNYKPSRLEGQIDVMGGKADLIIANPSGITCDGCSFRHSSFADNKVGVTLTTGRPILDTDGSLKNITTRYGTVTIGEKGLVAPNNPSGSAYNNPELSFDYINIISRAAQINGQLNAKSELNLIQGSNEINYKDGSITPFEISGSKIKIAVDTGALGGMYAGRIRLLSTEQGVGVNLGAVSSGYYGDTSIDVKGKLQLNKNSVQYNTVNYLAGRLSVSADQIEIAPNVRVDVYGDADIKSSIINHNGILNTVAAQQGERGYGESANIRLYANTVNNKGVIRSAHNLWIQKDLNGKRGDFLDNRAGLIETQKGDLVIRMDTVENAAINKELQTDATLYNDANLRAEIKSNRSRNKGQIISGKNLYINGDLISNYYEGVLRSAKDMILTGGILLSHSYELESTIGAYNKLNYESIRSSIRAGGHLVADFDRGIYLTNSINRKSDGYVRDVTRESNNNIWGSKSVVLKSYTINISDSVHSNGSIAAIAESGITIDDGVLRAHNGINLSAVNDISLNHANLAATDISLISRVGDINATTSLTNRYYTVNNYSPNYLNQSFGKISASGNLDLSAGKNILIADQIIERGKNASFIAGESVRIKANPEFLTPGRYFYKRSLNAGMSYYDQVRFALNKLFFSENVSMKAGTTLELEGIKIKAGKDVDLIAGVDVLLPVKKVGDTMKITHVLDGLWQYKNLEGQFAEGGELTATGDILIHAGRDLEIAAMKLSGNNINLIAGQHTYLPSMYRTYLLGYNGSENIVTDRKVSVLDAKNKLTLIGNGNLLAEGSEFYSANDMLLSTKGKMEFLAARNVSQVEGWDSITKSVVQQNSILSSRGNLNLYSDSSILFQATDLEAFKSITGAARGGFLYAQAMQESKTYEESYRKKRIFGSDKTGTSTTQQNVSKVVEFRANDSIDLLSKDDSTYQGSKLTAGKDVKLTSTHGRINLEAVRNTEFNRRTEQSKGIYIKQTDKGYTKDTWQLPQVHLGGNLTIGAAQGVTADIKTKGKQTLAQAINVLGNQPGTAWVKTLSNRNDVAWNQVQDAYTSWSHTEKHLNPVVGAVIAVAVAAVTSGTGLASWAGNALASTTQNALGQSVLYGMGSSGMSALVSKAAVSLVDNQGDLSKTLKDLGSKDSVKSLASSIITGGALAGLDNVLNLPVTAQSSKLPVLSNGDWNKIVGRVIGQSLITSGVNTGIYGGSFKDKLGNALLSNVGSQLHAEGAKLIGDYAKELGAVGKLLSHTTLAAMTAEIGRGNGKGAAAGALAIELAGASIGNNFTAKHAYAETVSKFNKVIGALAGGIVTGSVSGVNSGASAAEIVDAFNRQFHQNELDELQKLSANDDEKLERLIAAACRKVHCLAQGLSDSAEEAYLNALLKQYPNTPEEDELVNNATIMLPWRENLNGSYPAALPPSELNLFTYTHFDQSADTHQNIMYLWAKNYSEVMGTSLENGYRAAMTMAMFSVVLGSKTSKLGSAVLGTLTDKKSIILKNGFYSVDGMKISQSYYNRLWLNGRSAPFLQAREILKSNPKITTDPRGAEGYFRYEAAGLEMIYNPTTGQIGHIQPIKAR